MSNSKDQKIVGIAKVGCATIRSPKHTLCFEFHHFEKLPHERGDETNSPYLLCHGYLWRLLLYPGGNDKSKTETIQTSLFLECKHPENKKYEVETKYAFLVGGREIASSKGRVFKSDSQSRGWFDFRERQDILENYIDDLALIVKVNIEIRIKAEEMWTPSKRNFRNELLKMLQTGKDSDVTFIVGSEKFTAHRFILSWSAPDLRELVDDSVNDGEITIDNVDPSIFRSFLHFLYTDDLPPEKEFKRNTRSLLEIANKFGCTQLKIHAEASLVKNIMNEKNVLELLLLAEAMCCPLLKEAATNYCVTNASVVMSTEEWNELKKTNLAVFANVLESIYRHEHKKIPIEEGIGQCSDDNISELRKKLEEKGLDVDGTREMLVKRIQDNDNN